MPRTLTGGGDATRLELDRALVVLVLAIATSVRGNGDVHVVVCVGSLARSIRYFACCVEKTRYEGRGTENTKVY